LRCLAFKDGKNIELQSKTGESLSRYFPELIAALDRLKSKMFRRRRNRHSLRLHICFDDLLQKLHPAESRIEKLSNTDPAQGGWF
jgi:ATP-dependent DNA ligase